MESYNFEKLRGKHFACVYKLVFPNGKIYVGKSKEISKRLHLYERKLFGAWDGSAESSALYDAIREYGLDSIVIDILFRVNSASGADWRKDLDYALGIVEMRWIKELDSANPKVGYNATEGGEMFGVKNLEKVREIEKTRVVYNDVLVDRERQTNGVPVVGYDINGDFIGEWPSRVAFTRDVIHAKGTLDYGVWRKGFIMYEKNGGDYPKKVESYAEYIERTKAAEIEAKRVLEEKIGKVKTYREVRLRRGVVLVGMNGEEVSRHENMRAAADETGLNYAGIYACLQKGWGSTGGLYPFWSDEWDADHSGCLKRSVEKKVISGKKFDEALRSGKIYQYDEELNEVGEYENALDAMNKLGHSTPTSILNAAKKRGASKCGGFYWRFESDRIFKEQTSKQTNNGKLFSDDDF